MTTDDYRPSIIIPECLAGLPRFGDGNMIRLDAASVAVRSLEQRKDDELEIVRLGRDLILEDLRRSRRVIAALLARVSVIYSSDELAENAWKELKKIDSEPMP